MERLDLLIWERKILQTEVKKRSKRIARCRIKQRRQLKRKFPKKTAQEMLESRRLYSRNYYWKQKQNAKQKQKQQNNSE